MRTRLNKRNHGGSFKRCANDTVNQKNYRDTTEPNSKLFKEAVIFPSTAFITYNNDCFCCLKTLFVRFRCKSNATVGRHE